MLLLKQHHRKRKINRANIQKEKVTKQLQKEKVMKQLRPSCDFDPLEKSCTCTKVNFVCFCFAWLFGGLFLLFLLLKFSGEEYSRGTNNMGGDQGACSAEPHNMVISNSMSRGSMKRHLKLVYTVSNFQAFFKIFGLKLLVYPIPISLVETNL